MSQPIQLDQDHQNSFADTTPEQAQLNTKYAVDLQVAKYNAAKVTEYETQWAAYRAARDARPDATNLIEPAPAWAETVYINDAGWPFVGPSVLRVTDPHTYVPPTKTPSASIFGSPAGVLSTAHVLLTTAQLFVPFEYAGRKFQRLM